MLNTEKTTSTVWQKAWQLAKSEHWKLIPILALVVYIASIPHKDYPYPVHIDEWVHMARAEAMLRAGDTSFNDPFSMQTRFTISANLETGFQLFWGVFQRISGLSWVSIFRYFPSFIHMLTTLSVYILARRLGFGWEAAFFSSLIPTTVGIMGPAFLVPVAMGLIFISLSLFLAFNFKTLWSYLVLFIFTSFLLVLHPPTAVGLVIVLAPYVLLNLKGNTRHSISIGTTLALPFLLVFPWIFDMILPTAKLLLTPHPLPGYIDIPRVLRDYGYLPVGFGLLGTLALAITGGKKNFGLILGLLALLVMLSIYFTLSYGLDIMYTRGLLYMMLMFGIIAGAGLMALRKLPARFNEHRFWLSHVGNFLCLIAVVVTVAVIMPNRQQTPYYHMIDQTDYAAFTWIRDNVPSDYSLAVLDPWKATAFTAITQKAVYTKIHEYPKPSDMAAYKFLREGSTDTDFLVANKIAIVYTRERVTNPALTRVRENVYLYK